MFRRHMCSNLLCLKRHFSSATDVVKLSYTEYGKGNSSKKPLIVLHGLFGSKSNWHSLAKKLALDGRKVIAVDSRNHGESEHSSVMNYDVMATDMETLLDNLNLSKVVLLGHSMGGKVVMTTALKHPERVEGLIVVDVSPTLSSSMGLENYAKKMRDIRINQGSTLSEARKDVDCQLKSVVQSPGVRQFLLTNLIEEEGYYKWRLNLDAIIGNFQQILEFPEYNNTFDRSTLFIGGAKSEFIRGETTPEIHRLFPKYSIEMVQDAGHWVHSEKPREFLEIVKTFLMEKNL
ncbi:protein ABHD11 [Patella vulgata]|uniref:protein ABHD11 n=1 Tax=Patella vulgata TaxID=6465 RepID=UPI0021803C9B|nr:protein ABHD11 [Patella vulgata]